MRPLGDLHDLCSYIGRNNSQAAEEVGTGILDHVRILATFPFIGPAYPRGASGPLREIVFRPYRIFYDVSDEMQQVQILHVWHGARQEPTF
jgi:plasmid stabilization system protein ParE